MAQNRGLGLVLSAATIGVAGPERVPGDIRITWAAADLDGLLRDPEWTTVRRRAWWPVGGRGARHGPVHPVRGARRRRGNPYHVLDTMSAIDEAMMFGAAVDVAGTVDPVPLLDEGWDPFAATLE